MAKLLVVFAALAVFFTASVHGSSDVCHDIGGTWNSDTTSCFKVYSSLKSHSESHTACVDQIALWGYRGRLAILPTESSLLWAESNVPGFTEGQVWVALKADVAGSTNVADWSWYDGNTAVMKHNYGRLDLSGGNENCARRKDPWDPTKQLMDYNCGADFKRLCEFVYV